MDFSKETLNPDPGKNNKLFPSKKLGFSSHGLTYSSTSYPSPHIQTMEQAILQLLGQVANQVNQMSKNNTTIYSSPKPKVGLDKLPKFNGLTGVIATTLALDVTTPRRFQLGWRRQKNSHCSKLG